MEIVPQYPSVSYSPLLALCAPRIAGLLPARVAEPQKPPATLAFGPLMAALPDAVQNDLVIAAVKLLESAAAYINGAQPDLPLLRAESSTFVGAVHRLRMDSAGNPLPRASLVARKIVDAGHSPTVEEFDRDLAQTFQRILNRFQDDTRPKQPPLEVLEP